ncbi:hypothetical protein PTKU46_80520 [Paraburkholderia terrae]
MSLIKQGMPYQEAADQSGGSISTLLRARRKGRGAPDSRKRSLTPAPRIGALSDVT